MSETWCPILSTDPALAYVDSAHAKFMDMGDRTYNLAIDQANLLAGLTVLPTAFTVDFEFTDQLTPFQRPPAPTINLSEFAFQAPTPMGAAPAFDPQSPDLTPTPTADLTAPTLAYASRPLVPDIVAPTPPPPSAALVMPVAPDYVLPVLPTFEQLNLPTVPNITLPAFMGERPVFVEPNIAENFSFTPETYVSALLDKLKSKHIEFLNGGSALPLAIENALFDRGRSKIDLETLAAIETVYDEFASRGFSQPNGMLAARVDAIMQNGQNAIADYAREITLEAFKEALANLRLALQNGVALEGVAVNIHVQEQQLLLQSAQFSRETALALLNARVAIFNARLSAYQTDAQILAALIQAELAKVEVFRAQIEGERARGEINQQRVQLYVAQIQALDTLANFYRTKVETVKVQADVERSVIDRYKATIDAYGSRFDAYGKEVDGYRASVEAENSKVEVHRNLVAAYGSRIDAWSKENGLRFDKERLRLTQHGQSIEVYRADLARLESYLAAERARLGAVGQKADAQARIYSAAADVEQAASAAADRSFELGLSRARAEVDVQLEQARIRVQENVQLTGLMIEIRKTLATVMSQLAASSLSAVNYGATISSGRSQSNSCSANYSFSGEIKDA